MKRKNKKEIDRRSFLADTGKVLLFGTIVTAAIPAFLESCTKDEGCNELLEGENNSQYCNSQYLCTDSRGFACSAEGGFQCEVEGFSCYTVFSCTPESNFTCQPNSSYDHQVGGAGG
ncbi:MAG TPA: hypothetical protein VIN10_05310 [Bacteroidales bacterium]